MEQVLAFMVPQISEEIAKLLQLVPQGLLLQPIEEQFEGLSFSQIKEVIVSGFQLLNQKLLQERVRGWRLALLLRS